MLSFFFFLCTEPSEKTSETPKKGVDLRTLTKGDKLWRRDKTKGRDLGSRLGYIWEGN